MTFPLCPPNLPGGQVFGHATGTEIFPSMDEFPYLPSGHLPHASSSADLPSAIPYFPPGPKDK